MPHVKAQPAQRLPGTRQGTTAEARRPGPAAASEPTQAAGTTEAAVTIYVLLQLGYKIALAALTTCILLKGTWPMKRTIATVFAVFVAAWLLSDLWPSEAYAAAMIVVNALACVVITWHPAGKWQSVVGLSYILQIGVHVGRIANGDGADLVSYWWGLALLAILQLALVGGWWLNDTFFLHRRWRNPYSRSSEARRSGVV
jgi:hypothetical protein